MRINCNDCPHQCAEYEQDINHRKHIASKSELERSENGIEYEVQYKWQYDDKRNLFREKQISDIAVTDGNENVQESPYRTKEPRWWSPRGFHQVCIPFKAFHILK